MFFKTNYNSYSGEGFATKALTDLRFKLKGLTLRT